MNAMDDGEREHATTARTEAHTPHRIARLVSGGQTGADRAALDVALELGIPCGGWIPRGRRAEDGRIPDRYPGLRELESDEYAARTERNVREADATLVFSHGTLTGGSALTRELARRHHRPCLHIDLTERTDDDAVAAIGRWLDETRPVALNVAGPRASGDPLIHDATCRVLQRVLRRSAEAMTMERRSGDRADRTTADE
jgi:hypothetical protein